MTAPIGKGDWVICVEAGTSSVLHVGGVYEVERVFDAAANHVTREIIVDPHIHLVGVDERNLGFLLKRAYALRNFRPAGRGGMFNDLLTAKPVRVGEDA